MPPNWILYTHAHSSLALISARMTVNSAEILSMLSATYLYLLCQALDLRAMQADFSAELSALVTEELRTHFGAQATGALCARVLGVMHRVLDNSTTMDAGPRMAAVARAATPVLVDAFAGTSCTLADVAAFGDAVARRAALALVALREQYLGGARGPTPASRLLSRTRPLYEFVRVTLGIRMHGEENRALFPRGVGVDEQSIGQNVSLIHEVRVISLASVAHADISRTGDPRREDASCRSQPVRLRDVKRV
jgi:phenylalanine ammonia-lyase